jgi:hypothetical protein
VTCQSRPGGRTWPGGGEPVHASKPYCGAMATRWLLMAVALTACGGEAGGGEGGGAADTGPPAQDAGDCDRAGFVLSSQLAERDDELELLFYTGFAGQAGAESFDRLTVDFYFSIGATDAPHSWPLTGEDLADCHTCLLIYRGCSGTTCAAATTYLAQTGTLTVTSTGPAGSDFTGSITGAQFAEVEIDLATQHARLVPGGETWCLVDHPLAATIEAP